MPISSSALQGANPIQRAVAHLLFAITLLAGANVLVLLWRDSYDFHLGPLHLVAHGFFKPLLIFLSAYVLTILLRNPSPQSTANAFPLRSRSLFLLLAGIGIIWFLATSDINPLYDEWNYRGFSHDLGGWTRVWTLFATPQFGAWYRPLGFLSEWIDAQIFGDHLWGYHLQNVLWHLANAYLAGVLALRLRLSPTIATWATILFASASVVYEPVMWPSARFDLLAMTFTALALIFAIDYLQSGFVKHIGLAIGCYALAVISKESGYAFPLLLIPVALFVTLNWRDIQKRIATLLIVTFIVSIILLLIRWAVVGGVGGYPDQPGVGSPHLSFTPTTVQSIFTKLFPVSLLAANQMYPMPASVHAIIGGFVILLMISLFAGASTSARQRWIALLAIISTAPVATLVSWLDPAAQHVRYIYMPTLFVMILIAAALRNARGASWLLATFATLSLSIGLYDTSAYRNTYLKANELAIRISNDVEKIGLLDDSLPPHLKEVRILRMPAEFNGVLFSQFELMYQFQKRKTVPIAFISANDAESQTACGDQPCYLWLPDSRDLKPVGVTPYQLQRP